MIKLRILVTGSNGLIGRTFIETYKKNYKIFRYTKRDNLDKILKISFHNIFHSILPYLTRVLNYEKYKIYKDT
jgi:dTDP-D-glucose 4,6-dehydratase